MDPLPIEVSRTTIVLTSTTIAVSLVVLSTVAFDLFLAGLHARERDLLLDEIQDVRTQGTRTAGRIEQFLESLSTADLIVMGTHGRTGLKRLLMGSVAEAVVRRAPCPVLTLRQSPADGDVQPGDSATG